MVVPGVPGVRGHVTEEVVVKCCCGCGAESTDSLYWATEVCQIRWLSMEARKEQASAEKTSIGAAERVGED
jgi:hypothetical protein